MVWKLVDMQGFKFKPTLNKHKKSFEPDISQPDIK